MKKRFAMVLAATTALVGVGGAAQAAYTDCPQTYYCVWANTSYGGDYFASSINQSDYATLGGAVGKLENRSSSVYNNGTQSRIKAYVNADGSGWYFLLNNPYRPEGKSVRDPNLSNGAGYGDFSDKDFDNKLSRHSWLAY